MPASAWIMLIFGCLVIYGGFFCCLKIALTKRKKEQSEKSTD